MTAKVVVMMVITDARGRELEPVELHSLRGGDMNNAQTVPSPATVAANAARHRLADGQLARRAGSSREALAAYVAVKRVAQG